jgi:hypothetical protein
MTLIIGRYGVRTPTIPNGIPIATGPGRLRLKKTGAPPANGSMKDLTPTFPLLHLFEVGLPGTHNGLAPASRRRA